MVNTKEGRKEGKKRQDQRAKKEWRGGLLLSLAGAQGINPNHNMLSSRTATATIALAFRRNPSRATIMTPSSPAAASDCRPPNAIYATNASTATCATARFLPASGFQPIPEVIEPVAVAVKGTLPPWLAGSLYRLTASKFDIPLVAPAANSGLAQTQSPAPVVKAMHWFDGLSMLHKYELDGSSNTVKYRSRVTSKDTEQQIVADGCFSGFGPADPCRSLYKRVMSAFVSAGPVSGADGAPNINVTITPTATVVPPLAPRPSLTTDSATERIDYPYLIAKTDYKILQLIDPVTLNPLPISSASATNSPTRFNYTDLSPDLAGGVTSAAHHHQDPTTGDYYHFMIDIKGPNTQLVVFCIPAQASHGASATNARARVVARVPIGFAPYIHSFAATADYLVFILQPYYLGWDEGVVVSKQSGKCVRSFAIPEAVFFFHTVNAWQVQEVGGKDEQVVVDVVAYESPSLVYKMMVDRMSPELRGDQDLGVIKRFTIPLADATAATGAAGPEHVKCELVSPKGVELPRINPLYLTHPTRFVYCMLQHLDETTRQALDPERAATGFMRAICKVDTHTKSFAGVWTAPGCYPGEPVFIPRPSGNGARTEEDDGVVLTIVLDAIRSVSFLLLLDGKTFEEVARAEIEGPMPFGFHGSFVGNVKEMDAIN
ncbi:carotenoid oxygenase [Catenaria anguillulae PL171]|uniref:Carotenoid oxygenase n=1 Tax=Catenaria anguillulae PL171 TaxID=765915 RepID=A0A1Y2HDR2_9FUNG|nr:carotenoid oxygenase [Catenaria anguillulae PL171]